ncbi:ComEA family DNA-binding protein [Veronia pacifica]|uniref:Transporter n=1 Tax=Veronia pacifica TaxID=1080227 RepID=A0A1C3ERC4_9GAMM|nr:ComEA family DNA-binding protein [Veronia pacifica]ODA35787.1 hypothetical protein A8L45_01750 [Veronia pacifica]
MKHIISAIILSFAVLLTPVALAEQSEAAKVEQVNINTADLEELDKILIGIGEKKAQAIIDYRLEFGQFTTIEDLSKVKGIGEATVEKNRHLIVL